MPRPVSETELIKLAKKFRQVNRFYAYPAVNPDSSPLSHSSANHYTNTTEIYFRQSINRYYIN